MGFKEDLHKITAEYTISFKTKINKITEDKKLGKTNILFDVLVRSPNKLDLPIMSMEFNLSDEVISDMNETGAVKVLAQEVKDRAIMDTVDILCEQLSGKTMYELEEEIEEEVAQAELETESG